MRKLLGPSIVVLIAGIAAASQASGQTAPPPAASTINNDTTLTEVIVTAEKRSSSVQKTPMSITALRGEDLRQSGVTDMTAVAQQVPGVSFKTGGPGQTEFEMRGLNSAGGNSPTVGFYLDDTPLTSFAFAESGKVVVDPDLYDLSRVEVLRGPQGTLYGSGSMGGTIRLITNQPQLNEFHASGEVIGSGTEGGGANGAVNAMVNIPLVDDKLALRIVASDRYTSGWIDSVVLNPFPLPTSGGLVRGDVLSAPVASKQSDVNWNNLQGVRATLLWKPTDRLTITPMIMGQSSHAGGQTLIDSPPNTLAHYSPFDTPEPIKDKFILLGLNVKYDFDKFQIISSTSFFNRVLNQVQDGAEVLQDVLGLPSYYAANGGLGNNPWTEKDSSTQVSEEVRVTSKGESKFQWQGGVFYGDFTSKITQYSVDPAAVNLFGVATLFNEYVPQEFQQVALFGEASYQLTPALKATIGLRYFSFDNTFASTEYGFFAPNGNNNPSSSSSEAKETGVNPKFNVAWTPTRDLTVYATAAKGFRPGGGNAVIPTSGTEEGNACGANLRTLGLTANPTTYQPDSVWSYETGEKFRLFGDRLSVNGSVYYEDWSGIQRTVALDCGFVFTENGGSASIYGTELEVAAKLTPDFTVNVNGGYTHATYSTTSVEADTTKGEKLSDVPSFTSSQSIVYRKSINDEFSVVGRLMNNFSTSRIDVNYYVDKLPSYDILSGRIGLVSSKGWTGFLFVDNLTNKHALLNAINSQVLNIPTVTRDTTNQPRTFGVDLSYAF